jgi:hypothetical protein
MSIGAVETPIGHQAPVEAVEMKTEETPYEEIKQIFRE